VAVRFDILRAVADRLVALALTPTPTVRVRKKLVLWPNDGMPLILVCPGQSGEERAGGTFTKITFWRYPIVVAYITAGNQHVEEGFEEYLNNCQSIRDELFQPILPAVSKAFDTRINPEEVVRFAQAVGTNYDVTGWLGLYQTDELRKS
jgi:hypothetical protein